MSSWLIVEGLGLESAEEGYGVINYGSLWMSQRQGLGVNNLVAASGVITVPRDRHLSSYSNKGSRAGLGG